LRAYGADVEEVPAVAYSDPLNFNHRARDYAKGRENCVWTNQFDNVANRYGHFQTTGPEIYAQTDGVIDAFTCATGTGGTLAGVGMYLKQRSSKIKVLRFLFVLAFVLISGDTDCSCRSSGFCFVRFRSNGDCSGDENGFLHN
jgi:1-aminocyclopropane-1-carboxylate deaminase/D-cysteine desulfhydrase-like pyridoxal-dependent ACC family enzyme